MSTNRINPNAGEQPVQTYKPEVLAALREFRAAKPWRGVVEERKLKFTTLHAKLCDAYGSQWTLNLDAIAPIEGLHSDGRIRSASREIILVGKLSVVTYLFAFAAAVVFNGDCVKAREWSTNLYRRIFPRSAARMHYVNGFIIKPNNLN